MWQRALWLDARPVCAVQEWSRNRLRKKSALQIGFSLHEMVPEEGIEPPTHALRMVNCTG